MHDVTGLITSQSSSPAVFAGESSTIPECLIRGRQNRARMVARGGRARATRDRSGVAGWSRLQLLRRDDAADGRHELLGLGDHGTDGFGVGWRKAVITLDPDALRVVDHLS